ncbi:glycosyltransferase [Agrobacterium rosae]|uniref:glycosyltransferase n=1 Tax=Agrobacterium rosae TaxID=1972867 RepID=UPI001FD202E0|nr:glycosyltransferase [Agrobacterium rosae]
MAVSIVHNDDLEIETVLEDDHIWQSTGDDPAFMIRYGYVRKPFILIEISSLDEVSLDPKIYVNRGKGFSEADAIVAPIASRVLLTLDVGRLGNVCTVRFDPCTTPARFRFRVSEYESVSDMERHIAALPEIGVSERVDLRDIPRFWIKTPRLRLRNRSLITRFAHATYHLASKLEPEPHNSVAPWLSVIVPVYNAPASYLDDLVKSFEKQDQTGAELILSDDGSTSRETIEWFKRSKEISYVKFVISTENGGISNATNAGLISARGAWITFLDHDDLLAPYALKVIKRSLNQNPEAEFLYTDELVVDDRLKFIGAMLKPAYDEVLLDGVNYINHLSVYRRSRLQMIGELRTEMDGSQDYDLVLRYLQSLRSDQILHLPYPAYWWRQVKNSYSKTFLDKATENARVALFQRFQRSGKAVEIAPALTPTLHRPIFAQQPDKLPQISIIIPNINSFDLISRVLRDIFERTSYPNYEVIVVDNGTHDENVLRLYRDLAHKHKNFRADIMREAFNFSRSINRGLKLAKGEHYMLLNNDVEVIETDWLEEMVSCLNYSSTGIVGAKLLYSDGGLQHAGVIVGFGGLAGHWYLGKPRNFSGPMNRLHLRNSVTCVTGAVMLISGECARSVGLWNEAEFAIAYNDVDFCMRARKAGFRVIWTPYACLYHHESQTRGAEVGEEKLQRFNREKTNLKRIHATENFLDPSINPNLSTDASIPKLVIPHALHPARNCLLADIKEPHRIA